MNLNKLSDVELAEQLLEGTGYKVVRIREGGILLKVNLGK